MFTMENYYPNTNKFSLTLLLLILVSSVSFGSMNYTGLAKGNSPVLIITPTVKGIQASVSPASAPSSAPSPGTYTGTQLVTLSTTSSGASIRYTTDGTDPSSTVGTLYGGPISISANTILKSIAYGSGYTDSQVVQQTFTINCETPVLSPATGTYTVGQHVTMSSPTAGATIYYTTDGTQPTAASTPYSSRLTLNMNTTLKVVAIQNGLGDSQITTETYIILNPVVAPTFTPPAGTYNAVQNVTIASTTPGATIYYTTDGTTPSASGTMYNGPVTIGTSLVLRAIAVKGGMTNSPVSTAAYTIQILKTANPIFTPTPGNFTTPLMISINSPTNGSIIKYTTDGSTPSQTNGTVYTTPVGIIATTSFKAIAMTNGYTDSDIISAAYTITLGDADTDGDGVSDKEDDYPLDPTRSSNNLFPATGFGSLAFEDNWPLKADYDMNDMVIDYQFNQVTNSRNEVVEIKARFVLRAIGTNLHNGFGIEFPIAPSQVRFCEIKRINGTPGPFGNLITINPNGLENSNNPNAVAVLFDDGFKLFPQNSLQTVVNTSPDITWAKPDTLIMTLTLNQPINMEVFAKSRVYNPFIFKDKTRASEIHLPDFPPTSLANLNLFNTGEDRSDPATGKYYKTLNNLPWAINIYEGYDYPIEKTSIIDAFLHFTEWVQSNGVLFPDWYKLKDGYRKSNAIYTHP